MYSHSSILHSGCFSQFPVSAHTLPSSGLSLLLQNSSSSLSSFPPITVAAPLPSCILNFHPYNMLKFWLSLSRFVNIVRVYQFFLIL